MPKAYLVVSGTATDPEDEEIPGVYLVTVSDKAPKDLIEETALEAFHQKIGIENVDDFGILVYDAAGKPFPNQVSDSFARDNHPLTSWGTFEGGLNDDDVPFEVPSSSGSAPGI